MDELNTLSTPAPRKMLPVFVAAALLVVLALAVALWFYHPYFKAQRAIEAGEERRDILNTLPENPRAKNLTLEERQALLSGLESDQ